MSLDNLFQYAPGTAAYMMGQSHTADLDKNDAQIAELAQLIQARTGQENRAKDLHPLMMEKDRLANESTAALIPGQRATSRKLNTEADIMEAGKQDTIDKDAFDKRMSVYKTAMSHMGSISNAIEENPDVPPHITFAQTVDSLNVPPKFKQNLLNRYSRVPPSQLAEKLRDDRDTILRESENYAQHFDTTSLTTSAQLVNGAEDRASRERIAEADRNAGKFDRKGPKGEFNEGQIWAKRVADARSAKERHSAALGAIEFARRNDDPKAEGYYQAIADAAEAQARAEIAATSPKPGEVDVNAVTGGAVQTNPSLPIRGAQGRPAAGPQGGPANIEAMVKAQGGTYDPSRFEYRINPQTGKVQARPK